MPSIVVMNTAQPQHTEVGDFGQAGVGMGYRQAGSLHDLPGDGGLREKQVDPKTCQRPVMASHKTRCTGRPAKTSL